MMTLILIVLLWSPGAHFIGTHDSPKREAPREQVSHGHDDRGLFNLFWWLKR